MTTNDTATAAPVANVDDLLALVNADTVRVRLEECVARDELRESVMRALCELGPFVEAEELAYAPDLRHHKLLRLSPREAAHVDEGSRTFLLQVGSSMYFGPFALATGSLQGDVAERRFTH